MRDDRPLVVVVGPTAVGKTSVAIRLAQALHGEIISADSRQVYRCMHIGTASPSELELAAAPHHLVSLLDPDSTLTLAEYQQAAYAAIRQVHIGGKLPLLVGATGQYVRSVVQGWGIPPVPPQPYLRADLTTFASMFGKQTLHEWLDRVDPASAARIDQFQDCWC